MIRRLKNCPVCNSSLEIVEYHCPQCNTTITGKFDVGELDRLNVQQQEFVKIFLCCQGSIKEGEKALGISYPTVKNRLGEITKVLCPQLNLKKKEDSLLALKELENGKISVEEVIEKLKRR